ncbi:MAG: DUF1178 family protein [Rhizobiales bacterium]|nr:DUF1178 family protein [Hyphomicrobiales bacterium]
MIRYALACEAGHAFESWFRASDDFETQSKRGLISCPQCGSVRVTKQIMAPAVRSIGKEAAQSVALADPRDAEMRQFMRAYRQFVENNAEHVGDKFAEEARKIHYGETEERAIYGAATPTEVRELREEGVEVAPVPILPDERN